jgi:hypothetical protein
MPALVITEFQSSALSENRVARVPRMKFSDYCVRPVVVELNPPFPAPETE